MYKVFPTSGLTSDEQVLLDASDEDVETWLEAAKAGDEEATEHLCCWAYVTARRYYHLKVQVERLLLADEAEELASDFFLEFERTWPRIHFATRFSRRVLQNNLGRFLKRKRQRKQREAHAQASGQFIASSQVDKSSINAAASSWQHWSDEEWHQYQAVLKVLDESDEKTRRIITQRLKNPPVPYKEIARHMQASETAIRMRISRFYGAVRLRYREGVLKRSRPNRRTHE